MRGGKQPGAGRPPFFPGEPVVRRSVVLPARLWEAIRAGAEVAGVPESVWIAHALVSRMGSHDTPG